MAPHANRLKDGSNVHSPHTHVRNIFLACSCTRYLSFDLRLLARAFMYPVLSDVDTISTEFFSDRDVVATGATEASETEP